MYFMLTIYRLLKLPVVVVVVVAVEVAVDAVDVEVDVVDVVTSVVSAVCIMYHHKGYRVCES
jgi:hypothetical protein